MPRNETRAIELQKELDDHERQRLHLLEELRECSPARAEQSALKQQTLSIMDIEFLAKIDKGRLGKEFKKHVVRILKDIEALPFRRKSSGKLVLEERKLDIQISFLPMSSIDRDQIDGITISDLEIKTKVKSSLPNYESEPSLAAISSSPEGIFSDVRIHPECPENPRQLTFDDIGE